MTAGIVVSIADVDDDYLLIEIHARNERFAGSSRVYGDPDELTRLADRISGFPSHPTDERIYEFGSQDRNIAGGYVRLRFCCVDGVGHAAVDVMLEDDDATYAIASAKFSLAVEAAAVDEFVMELIRLHRERTGEAVLREAHIP